MKENIMEQNYYKENITAALRNLIKVNDSIFQSLIDVSVQGDLQAWNSTVPVGEVHDFSFELFKNSSDANIQLLVSLIENVDHVFASISNLNNIVLENDDYIDPNINFEEFLF